MEAFELRLWDIKIGRWLTTDPYGEFHSPYLGMGNNPISNIDPDGGLGNPVTDKYGNMLGTADSGMEGEVIVMDKKDFKQGMSDASALKVGKYLSKAGLSIPCRNQCYSKTKTFRL